MAKDNKSDKPDEPKPDEPKGDGKLKVSEHGNNSYPYAKHGRIVDGQRMPHPERWKHDAAAALHDWKLFAHHNNGEMKLSKENYDKAIEAACELDSKGNVNPHEPAMFVLKLDEKA